MFNGSKYIYRSIFTCSVLTVALFYTRGQKRRDFSIYFLITYFVNNDNFHIIPSPAFTTWSENQRGLLKLISKIYSHQKSFKPPMKNFGCGPNYILEFFALKYCSKTELHIWYYIYLTYHPFGQTILLWLTEKTWNEGFCINGNCRWKHRNKCSFFLLNRCPGGSMS